MVGKFKGKNSGAWPIILTVFGTLQTIFYIAMFAIVNQQQSTMEKAKEYIITLDEGLFSYCSARACS